MIRKTNLNLRFRWANNTVRACNQSDKQKPTMDYELPTGTDFYCLIDVCIDYTMVHKFLRFITLTCISWTVLPCCSLPPFLSTVRTVHNNLYSFFWCLAGITCSSYYLERKKNMFWIIKTEMPLGLNGQWGTITSH